MNPNSRGNYPPGYGPPNPNPNPYANPYAYQNAPVYDYSSGQYYYPQPQPWPTPNPNGGWQPQGYQQPYSTPNPNGSWQLQGPQPLNRDQQRAAARKVVLQCGNCSRIGHELKRCVGPVNAFGVIDGCPMCNTTDHVLFECVKAWKSDGNQRHLLMLGRNQKAMLSWPTELTEHSVWQALSANTRPKIWTPSFALQYQLENPHYWRDYVYARTWQEDPPIAEDPAWGNPSLVIHLKDRSERGLTRNASGLGRRPQSQLPPPSAKYFPPPMMPQFPSYASYPPPPPPSQPPRSAPASSPDTITLAGLESSLTKFAQNLMNLAPAGGNNGRGRKKLAIKGASNAKVKDRSQSPKGQTETETHRERLPLRTSGVKLADRMSYPKLDSSRVKADNDGDISDDDVEPLSKVENVLSNFDNAPGDAASAAKAARKTILNRKNRAKAKARRDAAKAKDRSQSPEAQIKTETYRERSPLRTPYIKLEKLEDPMSYPELKPSWAKADNDVEPKGQ
ncbi:hypothetical protein BELL_0004g00020 [Botrytis elliptica]|uniref:Uncharacterized protein n=1 Tax=Botrytis elliptica TaxID=278938 RepID=A0A4Z1K4J1_9HELO|nr:hypothetical protein EAE99_001342 [Botrytis elliptica]TGO80578.1 hypothetical protein BELL_0004g00020 [Botrytis elliptica]